MNLRQIWVVFQKEMMDLFRDRKTWIGAFLIPILIIPLIFFLLKTSMDSVQEEARSQIPIALMGNTQHALAEQIRQIPGSRIVQPEDPIQAIRDGEVRAAVHIPDDTEQLVSKGKQARITLYYDPSNQKSSYAVEVIQQTIQKMEDEIVRDRLAEAGLDQQAIQPFDAQLESVATEERLAGSILSGIVPLMLILAIASGGIPAATDLVAGEKERGTIEPLIGAPISSGNILLAKVLTVMCMSLVSALASFASIMLTVPMFVTEGDQTSINLSFLDPSAILVFVLTALLMAAMYGAAELAISASAKSFKEAQTYMTPVVLVSMVPSYMMMPINPTDMPFYYFLLPIFNGASLFKEILYGEWDLVHILTVFATLFVYGAIAVWIASRQFRRERLLTG